MPTRVDPRSQIPPRVSTAFNVNLTMAAGRRGCRRARRPRRERGGVDAVHRGVADVAGPGRRRPIIRGVTLEPCNIDSCCGSCFKLADNDREALKDSIGLYA